VAQTTPETVISTPIPGLLPHSIYFLMGGGNSQVWRLSTDAAVVTQITFEANPVTDYAVSPVNGALAYITNNRLYFASATTGKRILVVDGGALNGTSTTQPGEASRSRISSPAWSPDGKSLAFGNGGINIFLPGNGKVTRLLANGVLSSTDGSGKEIEAVYAPYAWSPDNRRLAIEMVLDKAGSTLGILSLANGRLVRLHQPSASPVDDLVCCQSSWSNDSTSLFVANFYVNLPRPTGLWRFEPSSGAGSVMLPSIEKDGTYNYAGWPLQLVDGSLVYWYANTPAKVDTEPPMNLVTSGPDAVFKRTLLRPETILPQEVLWSEQRRMAVIVQLSPGTSARNPGGPVLLVQWDGSPAQPLLSNAYRLEWGP
jgi:WD40 repeat protein